MLVKKFFSHEDTKMLRFAAGIPRCFDTPRLTAAWARQHGRRRNIFVSSCETPFLFAHKAPAA